MKIVIPVVNHEEKRYMIANGLNMSSYMCLYDTETEKFKWLTSEEVTPKGKNWIASFKHLDLGGLIVQSINPMAYNLFVRNDIKVYKAPGEDLNQAIAAITDNALPYYTEQDMEDNGCNGTCSTCETVTCKTEEN